MTEEELISLLTSEHVELYYKAKYILDESKECDSLELCKMQSVLIDMVRKAYFKIFDKGYLPKSKDVFDLVCYDIEVATLSKFEMSECEKLTEAITHRVLSVFGFVHAYKERICGDAQNVLFYNWFPENDTPAIECKK